MYQPKLRDELIRRLYRLGKALDVPMTGVANVLMEYGITMLEQALAKMGYMAPENKNPKKSRKR